MCQSISGIVLPSSMSARSALGRIVLHVHIVRENARRHADVKIEKPETSGIQATVEKKTNKFEFRVTRVTQRDSLHKLDRFLLKHLQRNHQHPQPNTVPAKIVQPAVGDGPL